MDPEHRQLTLLLTSPRVAPGLLSVSAWDRLREAEHVLARDAEAEVSRAIGAAGVQVHTAPAHALSTPAALAAHLLSLGTSVVWVGSPDGDPGLAEALAVTLPDDDPPELELLVGSWDTPGARLLDAVAVMDRLRSPGGCPWDAQQTHASLTPYLIEEAYEAAEVLEQLDDDRPGGGHPPAQPEDDAHRATVREEAIAELGDVLLQVLFHARVGAEHDDDPFDIDDIAATLVAKLVRRHPHVFARTVSDEGTDTQGPGAAEPATPASVEASWEQIKAQETAEAGKPARTHPLDGIPTGMPSLARAAKVASRLERAGEGDWLRDWAARSRADGDAGAELLTSVLDLRSGEVDPDAALRHTLRAVERSARLPDGR